MGDSRYYVTFIDDYTRHTSGHFIKTKDEVLEQFKTFYNFAENFTGKQVKVPPYLSSKHNCLPNESKSFYRPERNHAL